MDEKIQQFRDMIIEDILEGTSEEELKEIYFEKDLKNNFKDWKTSELLREYEDYHR